MRVRPPAKGFVSHSLRDQGAQGQGALTLVVGESTLVREGVLEDGPGKNCIDSSLYPWYSLRRLLEQTHDRLPESDGWTGYPDHLRR